MKVKVTCYPAPVLWVYHCLQNTLYSNFKTIIQIELMWSVNEQSCDYSNSLWGAFYMTVYGSKQQTVVSGDWCLRAVGWKKERERERERERIGEVFILNSDRKQKGNLSALNDLNNRLKWNEKLNGTDSFCIEKEQLTTSKNTISTTLWREDDCVHVCLCVCVCARTRKR